MNEIDSDGKVDGERLVQRHDGKTLAEEVYDMVSRGEQKGEGFKSLVAIFGRERLLELYRQECARRKQNPA